MDEPQDGTRQREPSNRQVIAARYMIEKGGTIADAMRAADYSENTIKNPQHLTLSKGFQKLLVDMGVDQRELGDVLKGGLRATSKKPHLVDRDDKGRPVYEYMDEDDWATRHRYLETALRLHGLAQPDQSRSNINFIQLVQEDSNGFAAS